MPEVANELSTIRESDRTVAEVEKTPEEVVGRWIAELEMADAAEKDWREEAKEIWLQYEGDKAKAFNMLWSNTETVQPSVYNSTPKPDVRRRFRDDDVTGKWASRAVERGLSYSLDVYDSNEEVQMTVLDAELLGRGILRNKYKPTFEQIPQGVAMGQVIKTPDEKLVDERVEWEHVQWDHFRRGPCKRWARCPWVAFYHEFTKDMAAEAFGQDIAEALTYVDVEHLDKVSTRDESTRQMFKVCVVWEFWDKEQKRVLFIAPSYKDKPCKEVADPLQLDRFWPMPRPVYTIRNSKSMVPIPRYRMYAKKAEQLERISTRIDKVVYALKVRGAYASSLPELDQLLSAADGDLIAIQNVSAVFDAGGLDKMIWMLPIEKLASCLEFLYKAAANVKQEIYEIIGLSDIMRGATDASETLGAQELKSQWGSVRLENYKREIQRLCRDGMRIKAEMMCDRFGQDTWEAVTGIILPTAQQKMMAQMAMRQAQQMGAQPPPEAQLVAETPTWADVIKLLKNDFLRCTRIDIETDSTVAETVNKDFEAQTQLLGAIGKLFTDALPAVQSGLLPVEAVKGMAIQLARRARLGQSVEDALDKVQQPMPEQTEQPQPEVAEPHPDTARADQAEEKAGQLDAKLRDEQSNRKLDQRENALNVREAQHGFAEKQLGDRETALTDQQKEQADTGADQETLTQTVQQMAQMQAQSMQQLAEGLSQIGQALAQQAQTIADQQAATQQALAAMVQAISKPKEIKFSKGADGRIDGASAH